MQKLKDWFFSLQPRERVLVLGGAGVVLLFAIYFLALGPFYSAVSSRAERVAKKQGDLAWMRSVGGEVLALSANSTAAAVPSNESLVVLIDRSARECGLGSSLTGQTPNGANGIRVRLEQAEFDKLVVCLGGLQQSHSVMIESANIDRTGKPGFVNASLVLTRPGG
jgi:type II secretory pathway component PulM